MARHMLRNVGMTTNQQDRTEQDRNPQPLKGTEPWIDDDRIERAVEQPPREPRCVDGELLDA